MAGVLVGTSRHPNLQSKPFDLQRGFGRNANEPSRRAGL